MDPVRKFLVPFFPSTKEIIARARLFLLVVFGAALIFPLVRRLPMLGWDWGFFFMGLNPTYNLYVPGIPYPPFARFFIQLFQGIDWRESLAFLNAMTLLTLALVTWQQGGKYGSIALALTAPPVWFLLYAGHPDGLALLGFLTGFVPLALIKPQLMVWTAFTSRRLFVWTVLFLGLSLIVWPLWPLRMGSATITHEAAFGWSVTGWPVAVLGLLLFAGAGSHPYRLVAAGLLLSPYLMPYNLAVLAPAIGCARGWRKILIWSAAWFTILGTGLGGSWKLANLLLPILVYLLLHSWRGYQDNLSWLAGLCSWAGLKKEFQAFRQPS